MNPGTNPTTLSRTLSVVWRIENFSLLGYFISVKSAPFSLRFGAEEKNPDKFYIAFHPTRALFFKGSLQLRPCDDNASRSTGNQPPLLRVSFSTLLATGKYLKFHDKGRILNELEVKDCKGWFKHFIILLQNRTKYLPDDSLTFLVQFSSDEPVFEVERLFSRTWIPIKKSSFEWEIDLSKGDCSKPVPGLPIVLRFRPSGPAYDILVISNCFKIDPIVFDVFLKKDSGEMIAIKKIGFVNVTGDMFSLTENFCKDHVKEALRKRGSLTLYFEFCTDDGDPVSEDFGETPLRATGAKRSAHQIRQKEPKKASEENVRARNDMGDVKSAGNTDSTRSANAPKTKRIKGAEKNTGLDVDLVPDLKKLYSQQIFSDYSLRVGDWSFPVHRNILSARSEVFRAMFEEEDMLEKRDSCSEVTDVDENTMDRMLRFVYFNELQNQDFDGSVKLFAAAVKYKIGSLKSRCVDSLEANISAENVCVILSLADALGDEELMSRAKEFLSRNAGAVFSSEGWRRLMAEKSELACRLMHEKLMDQQIFMVRPPTKKKKTEEAVSCN